MPGWPDWQKETAWTFPPTIGAANFASLQFAFAADVTQTLVSYTDGKVHVLYVISVYGSITNTDTANDKTPIFRVLLSRGIDNSGGGQSILTASYHVATAVAGAVTQTVGFDLELHQPILFQAGSVGTPNVLEFVSSSGQVGYKAACGITVIDWAVT